MQEAFGTTVELIKGSGGVFDVMVEDSLVYSKAATGSFPDEDVLLQELRAKYA